MRVISYSKSEELLNIITHIIGFIVTLVLFIPIIINVINVENKLKLLSRVIYFISIAMMFLASSLYHLMTNPRSRVVFRAIDHGVIYLTIAGSYTPIILLGIRSTFSIIIFIIVRILAIIGIIMNIVAFVMKKEDKIKKASMIIYITMGWISVLLIYQMFKALPFNYLIFLVLGGLFYTAGAIFYSNKKIKYNHAIWHIFILIATFTMFYGNYLYLT